MKEHEVTWPQSALHYHLSAAPQVAVGEGKNRLTDDLGGDETERENKGVACLFAYVSLYMSDCMSMCVFESTCECRQANELLYTT